MFLYTVALIPIMYNLVQFIIRQQKYKNFFVLVFYLTTLMVFASRFCEFAILHSQDVNADISRDHTAIMFTVCANYSKIVMGIFQCAAIS
jgi:hypothetical protein